eukprot:TRINITY_DN9877_c0_g1_i1.p1 TRINITY_DN9877_c0_g1~~TRINITY_DN9877_c0_g1_i1.p1  ORF type:complete len:501 (+),score=113.27 TRINITY_DN9877_c0_g1_i1:40-1542(+)
MGKINHKAPNMTEERSLAIPEYKADDKEQQQADKKQPESFITELKENIHGRVSRPRFNWAKINKLHTQLDTLLDFYGPSLLRKIEREDEDYLLAYNAEMLKVQKTLDSIQLGSEKMKNSLLSENCILVLEHSLTWFKDEAGRLAESIDEQNRDIALWKERIDLYNSEILTASEELKHVTAEVKALEIGTGAVESYEAIRPRTVGTRGLKAEAQRTPQTAVALKGMPRICYVIKYMLMKNEERGKILEETVRYHNDQIAKNQDVVIKLEQKLQQALNQSMNPSLGRQIRRTKLLEIFLASIERAKLQICNRAFKNSRGFSRFGDTCKKRAFSAVNRVKNLRTAPGREPLQVRMSSFTATDKKAVFVQFLNSPEVYERIRSIVNSELSIAAEKTKLHESPPAILSGADERNQMTYAESTPYGSGTLTGKKQSRFHASHLYAIPQVPEGFRTEYKHRTRKSGLQSSHAKRRPRPDTTGGKVVRPSFIENVNNGSLSAGVDQPY